MMEGVTRRMIMLRPMQAGLSGYARLQEEAGWQLLQINLRGLQGCGMRAFWYAGEGLVRELGRAAANARGEAALSAELPMDPAAPGRLTALLIADDSDKPRPLAIGLCAAQSAGSLMDAKNALLALCDKLNRMAEAEKASRADATADGGNTGRKEPGRKEPGRKEPGRAVADSSRKTKNSGNAAQAENRLQDAQLSSETDKPAGGDDLQAVAFQPESLPHSPPSPESRRATAGQQARHKRSPRHAPAEEPPREVFLPAIEARRPPRRRRGQMEGSRPGADDAEAAADQVNGQAAEPQTDNGAASCTANHAADSTPHVQPTADHAGNRLTVSKTSIPHTSGTAAVPGPHSGQPTAPPADLLPALHWPAPFESLAGYFHRYPPTRLMNWPGWRFVHVPEGGASLWIGYRQQDGQVRQVAYALPGDAETPRGQSFRAARSAGGLPLQLLVLDCTAQ